MPEHRFERAPDDGDNSSDLASVPSWLWWFIASYGRQTRPALLHDYLVDAEPKRRRNADRVFRIALEESGIGYVRRWLMWTTVSFATWLKAGWWRLAFVLFVLHAGAFVGAVAYSIFASDWSWLGGRWWAAPALWLGLSGFLWGHRWPFTFLGIALILPPTVCVWIVIPLVWLLDLLAEGLGWIGSRIPGVGPPRDFSWPVLSPQRHRPSLF